MHSSSEFNLIFIPWMTGIIALALVYTAFFWSTHFYPRSPVRSCY
jgi:hypothetical protein